MNFPDRLAKQIQQKKSCLMLGLDPHWEKIPTHLKPKGTASRQDKAAVYLQFCGQMIQTCEKHICGIKIQLGYFEVLGSIGIAAVERLIALTRQHYPDLIIMLDAKRGDIGSTSEAYAQAFLGKDSPLSGDCVTVAPYMGTDSVVPFAGFAEANNKGVFVLAKTSNPGSTDIQDAKINTETVAELWCGILEGVSQERKSPNQPYSLYGAVVGATHPEELPKFREILKSCWILAPGVGAQGGKLEDVLKIRDQDGLGVVIPLSRSVLYASDGEDYLHAAQNVIGELWKQQKTIYE